MNGRLANIVWRKSQAHHWNLTFSTSPGRLGWGAWNSIRVRMVAFINASQYSNHGFGIARYRLLAGARLLIAPGLSSARYCVYSSIGSCYRSSPGPPALIIFAMPNGSISGTTAQPLENHVLVIYLVVTGDLVDASQKQVPRH